MRSSIFTFLICGAALLQPTPSRGQLLDWAAQIGGTGVDSALAVAVDTSGNVYSVGYFEDTVDFDPGPAAFNLTSAGLRDIFVSKLDGDGNFVWAAQFGGTSYDEARAVTIDAAGNIYLTGHFVDTVDFDPGVEAFELTSDGWWDVFILKLDSDGQFVWVRRMGGIGGQTGSDVIVDDSGNVYTTGYFEGNMTFDPGIGSVVLTSAGLVDIFVAKHDPLGELVWARRMGGAQDDLSYSVAIDDDSVFVAGSFKSTATFNPNDANSILTAYGLTDAFVSKFDSDGHFLWVKQIKGLAETKAVDIAVDGNGDVVFLGTFGITADFDPGVGEYELTSNVGADVFVTKLDNDGQFVWAKQMDGPSTHEAAGGLALDSNGNIYVTGRFGGTVDFDPGPAISVLTATAYDAFIARLNSTGDFVWARDAVRGINGSEFCVGKGISLDGDSRVYIAGFLQGTCDFDPSSNISSVSAIDRDDAFVASYSQPVFPASAGVYFNGQWTLDSNANDVFDPGIDRDWTLGGFGSSQPVTGDWNGDGIDDVGVFNEGYWFLDLNGNGVYDEDPLPFGWSGVTPVVGDWDGDGRTNVGVYSNGFWFLDYDGDHLWDNGVNDKIFGFGWEGVTLKIGDWNGDGRDKLGIFKDGFWFLDYDGSYSWDGGVQDKIFGFGWTGVTPLVGDWDGDGRDSVAVYSNGFWFFDHNGDTLWDGGTVDRIFGLGWDGAIPVIGDWNGDGSDSAGVFSSGTWFIDDNSNGIWDGVPTDRVVSFGTAGDTPMPGKW